MRHLCRPVLHMPAAYQCSWATAPISGLERIWKPKTLGGVREEKEATKEALEPLAPSALSLS